MPPEQPGERTTTRSSITRMNVRIADLVKDLETDDLVEVLTGRASSLVRADANQNQNQNGSRAPRAIDED